jgi:quercetin dioxygenase-like cupin family protein
MLTHEPLPEEIEARTARFASLEPQASRHNEASGVPIEAYEMMTAKTLYLLMAPNDLGGPMAEKPAIDGPPGISFIIAECPSGNGPPLHAHEHTDEIFMCLEGAFEVQWGDRGQHKTRLERFDMVSMPPGVVRRFCNVSDRTGFLFVAILGSENKDFNDISMAPIVGEEIALRFGSDVRDRMSDIGFEFKAGIVGEA